MITITIRGAQGSGKSLTCMLLEQAFEEFLNGEPPRSYDDEGSMGRDFKGRRLHPQQYDVLKNTHFLIRTDNA